MQREFLPNHPYIVTLQITVENTNRMNAPHNLDDIYCKERGKQFVNAASFLFTNKIHCINNGALFI